MRQRARGLAFAALAAVFADRPDSCAFKLVPIHESEQSFYWPGEHDRCHVLAKKVIVLHGGLFSRDDVTLDDLRKVVRSASERAQREVSSN